MNQMQDAIIKPGSKVLVTGAGGFIGKALVQTLVETGYTVRAMVRHDTLISSAEVIQGDITNEKDVMQAVEGMDAVIHLAARKSDERDSEAVNITGTVFLADACKKAGIQRVINISTQSVKLPTLGTYGRTKKESEAIMQASGIPTITLRPSVVYSDEGGGILSTILGFCSLPIIPMIGSGNIGFQPIHTDDLAAIITQSLTHGTPGTIYDVGGTDRRTLRELTNDIQTRLGMKKWIFCIPLPVAMLIARLTSWMKKPPVTISNVLGGSQDVPMNIQPMLKDFGVTPRSFSNGLDAVFLQRRKLQKQVEAKTLLRYTYSASGWWEPTPSDVARFEDALLVHRIPETHELSPRAVRSPWILGALDAVAGNTSALKQKILIASAIAECSTQTAEFSLPKEHSIFGILWMSTVMGIRIACKTCIGYALLLFRPHFTYRNVG